MTNSLLPSTEMFDLIQRDFSTPLKDRLVIYAEVDKYRWKEDVSVWRQKREQDALAYEVTFDGEFVCFFDLSETSAQVRLKILEGIRKLYQEGKIFFNKKMYEVAKAEHEEKLKKQKTVEVAKPTTPEEKLIVGVIEKQAKRKGKKVVVKE